MEVKSQPVMSSKAAIGTTIKIQMNNSGMKQEINSGTETGDELAFTDFVSQDGYAEDFVGDGNGGEKTYIADDAEKVIFEPLFDPLFTLAPPSPVFPVKTSTLTLTSHEPPAMSHSHAPKHEIPPSSFTAVDVRSYSPDDNRSHHDHHDEHQHGPPPPPHDDNEHHDHNHPPPPQPPHDNRHHHHHYNGHDGMPPPPPPNHGNQPPPPPHHGDSHHPPFPPQSPPLPLQPFDPNHPVAVDPSLPPVEPITELNPLILQADLDFISTPLTEKYTTKSIAALNNVQQQCAVDYMKNCLFPSFAASVTTDIMNKNKNDNNSAAGGSLTSSIDGEEQQQDGEWMSLNGAMKFFNPALFMSSENIQFVMNGSRRLTGGNDGSAVVVARAPLLSLKHQFHKVMDAKNLVLSNGNNNNSAATVTADSADVKITKPVTVVEDNDSNKNIINKNKLERKNSAVNKISKQDINEVKDKNPNAHSRRHLRGSIKTTVTTTNGMMMNMNSMKVSKSMVKDMTTALGAAMATEDEYVPEGEPVPAFLLNNNKERSQAPSSEQKMMMKGRKVMMMNDNKNTNNKMTMGNMMNNKMMQHNDHHSDSEVEDEDVNDVEVDSDNEEDEEEAEILIKEGIDIIAVENTDGTSANAIEGNSDTFTDNNNVIAYEDEDLEYYADVTTEISDIFDPIDSTTTTEEEPTAVPSKHHPHPPPPLPPVPPCEMMAYAAVLPTQTWFQYLTNTHPPMPPQPPCADGTGPPLPPPPHPHHPTLSPNTNDNNNNNNDPHDHHHDHHHHDGGDNDNDEHHHHPPPPPYSSTKPFDPFMPPPPVPVDTTYTGSLGYGTAGDQCMMNLFAAGNIKHDVLIDDGVSSKVFPPPLSHMMMMASRVALMQQQQGDSVEGSSGSVSSGDSGSGTIISDPYQPSSPADVQQLLSPGCQNAISDVYTLRAEYFNEYAMITDANNSDMYHNHPPPMPSMILPVFLLLMVTAVVARRLYRYPYRKYRRQQINNVLSVLESNPQLKAAVEAETGSKLPENLPTECSHRSSGSGRRGFWNKVLRVIGLLFSAFVLAMTSVVITANIIISHYDMSGEVTSPAAAGGIMFGVLLVQLVGVYLLYKGVRYIVNRDVSGGGSDSNNNTQSSSSAQQRDVYINNDNTTGYGNNGNNNNNGSGDSSAAHAFGQRIRYVYNDIVTRITGNNNNNGGGNNQSHSQSHTLYEPLTSDTMDSSTERGGCAYGNEIIYAPSAPTVVTRTVYHQPAMNNNNNNNTTVHNPMTQQQYSSQPQYTSFNQQPQPVMYYAPRVASAQPVSNINMM